GLPVRCHDAAVSPPQLTPRRDRRCAVQDVGDGQDGHVLESFDPAKISYVAAMDIVRENHPKPMTRATGKGLPRLDRHCRAILQHSAFGVIGTHGPDGADVSPRGAPPGFARVLDDGHILLPDRIGNNRFDSYANLFHSPEIGLLFLVPGMAEI